MRELCGAYERSGALSSHARYAAEHLARLRCCQAGTVTLSTPAASSQRVPPYTSTVQFDAQGALLACTPSAGGVQVFSFLELSAHCSLHAHSAGSANLAPLLRLAAERPVEALRWSVANQDLVATASLLDCDVHLFDLGVCDDAPTEVLHGEHARNPSSTHSAGGGLCDIAFFSSDSRKLLAAGQAGKVLLWDTRTGRRPRACLSAPRTSGKLLTVQLASDDHVAYVSAESGDIFCWDLRGGRQATTAFVAPNQVTLPLLHTLSVTALLLEVPALADEVDIESSAVCALAFDPRDCRRLAFQLARGWSGVVDLLALAVTHLHCPPPPWEMTAGSQNAERHALLTVKRRPAWAADAAFLTGSHGCASLSALDFSATPSAGCHVGRPPCTSECVAERNCRACRRPHMWSTLAPVVAVAAHPTCGDIVVGTQGAKLQLLTTGGGDES